MKKLVLILLLFPVFMQAQIEIKDQLLIGYTHKEEHKGGFNFMSRCISLAGIEGDSLVFLSKGNRFAYYLDAKELLELKTGGLRYRANHLDGVLFFYFTKFGDLYMAIIAKNETFIKTIYFR